MKNLILLLITALLFSSCSMEKRLYRPGWYVHSSSGKGNEKSISVLNKKTEPVRPLAISSITPAENLIVEILPEKTETDFRESKKEMDLAEINTVLPDSSGRIKQKPRPKPDYRNSHTRLICNEDFMFGIGLAFVAILYLVLFVVICFLGAPFLGYLFLLALLAPLTALWAWSRLGGDEFWRTSKLPGRMLGNLFYYSSITIMILFAPVLFVLLISGWVIYFISQTISDACDRKSKRAEPKS